MTHIELLLNNKRMPVGDALIGAIIARLQFRAIGKSERSWGLALILTGYISNDIFTPYVDTLAALEGS